MVSGRYRPANVWWSGTGKVHGDWEFGWNESVCRLQGGGVVRALSIAGGADAIAAELKRLLLSTYPDAFFIAAIAVISVMYGDRSGRTHGDGDVVQREDARDDCASAEAC
jgi:hypothetical protein